MGRYELGGSPAASPATRSLPWRGAVEERLLRVEDELVARRSETLAHLACSSEGGRGGVCDPGRQVGSLPAADLVELIARVLQHHLTGPLPDAV